MGLNFLSTMLVKVTVQNSFLKMNIFVNKSTIIAKIYVLVGNKITVYILDQFSTKDFHIPG